MKTIKQIADEIGVSKQAIRNQIANLGLQSSLRKNANQFVIDENQEKLIIQSFNKKTQSENANQSQSKVQTENKETQTTLHFTLRILEQEIDFLKNQIVAKDRQLEYEREHSREQSKRLADLAEQLAELNRNNQILLGSEQTRNNQTSQSFLDDGGEATEIDNSIKNQGFFSKLFKKNKRII